MPPLSAGSSIPKYIPGFPRRGTIDGFPRRGTIDALPTASAFLPLAFLVGPTLGLGLIAIWIVQGCNRTLQACIFLGSWKRRGWQHIEI